MVEHGVVTPTNIDWLCQPKTDAEKKMLIENKYKLLAKHAGFDKLVDLETLDISPHAGSFLVAFVGVGLIEPLRLLLSIFITPRIVHGRTLLLHQKNVATYRWGRSTNHHVKRKSE
jgi:hypothetical protein